MTFDLLDDESMTMDGEIFHFSPDAFFYCIEINGITNQQSVFNFQVLRRGKSCVLQEYFALFNIHKTISAEASTKLCLTV